jgi:DNA-binding transcriptional MerR regulator
MPTVTYTMPELESASGISARTIRKYMSMAMLPRGSGQGRGARYDERHLRRVRLIHQLRAQGEKLTAIRLRLQKLSEAELDAMLLETRPITAPTELPPSPVTPFYPHKPCEIVELMDGLTLTVDPNKGELVKRVAAAIYRHYAHH